MAGLWACTLVLEEQKRKDIEVRWVTPVRTASPAGTVKLVDETHLRGAWGLRVPCGVSHVSAPARLCCWAGAGWSSHL